MSYRIFAASLALILSLPGHATAQLESAAFASSLGPSVASTALLPARSALVRLSAEHDAEPIAPQLRTRGSSSLLVESLVLAGASLAGLWIGMQPPFPAMDDDTDVGTLHLVTVPLGSVAAVAAASMLRGGDTSSSIKGSLLGAAAGLGAALVSSQATDGPSLPITYVTVHGLVSALFAR
jgi:hypothetical protein